MSLTRFAMTLLMFSLAQAGLAGTDEEAEIGALAGRWERAWNQHDMDALAALFTDDADFVNVGAKHWKGRGEIKAQHQARLSQFRDSRWTTKSVSVQSLSPDIALVHVDWGIEGDRDPDGTARQPREGLFTWVVVRAAGTWRIRAAQNTNVSHLPPPAMNPGSGSSQDTSQ